MCFTARNLPSDRDNVTTWRVRGEHVESGVFVGAVDKILPIPARQVGDWWPIWLVCDANGDNPDIVASQTRPNRDLARELDWWGTRPNSPKLILKEVRGHRSLYHAGCAFDPLMDVGSGGPGSGAGSDGGVIARHCHNAWPPGKATGIYVHLEAMKFKNPDMYGGGFAQGNIYSEGDGPLSSLPSHAFRVGVRAWTHLDFNIQEADADYVFVPLAEASSDLSAYSHCYSFGTNGDSRMKCLFRGYEFLVT